MRAVPLFCVFGLAIGVVCSPATAQVGPALLLKPWEDGSVAELSAGAMFEPQASLRNKGEVDARVSLFESAGRTRVSTDAGDHWRLAFGYEMNYLQTDFRGQVDGLPVKLDGHLADQKFFFGARLGEWEEWTLDAGGGFGFSYQGIDDGIDSDHFVDAHGFYGVADVIASRRLDESSSIRIILDYDGNRAILPDVPLPSITYSLRVDETFNVSIGLPYSVLVWKPDGYWSVEIEYVLPTSANVTVGYEIVEDVKLFAAYQNVLNAYKINDDLGRRFFEQMRGELGLTWRACKACSLTIAGGWAFQQDISLGWDARDLDRVAKLGDAPYGRVSLALTF